MFSKSVSRLKNCEGDLKEQHQETDLARRHAEDAHTTLETHRNSTGAEK
jgi:hypothetical protein